MAYRLQLRCELGCRSEEHHRAQDLRSLRRGVAFGGLLGYYCPALKVEGQHIVLQY